MIAGYLVDTNVLSETARPRPSPRVLAWLGEQAPIRLAAVTLYELARGVQHVAPGRRRRFLEEWLGALLAGNSVVFPFDEKAALVAASIEREARRRGRPVADRDLFILATAASHGLGLASRNLADVEARREGRDAPGAALYPPQPLWRLAASPLGATAGREAPRDGDD